MEKFIPLLYAFIFRFIFGFYYLLDKYHKYIFQSNMGKIQSQRGIRIKCFVRK